MGPTTRAGHREAQSPPVAYSSFHRISAFYRTSGEWRDRPTRLKRRLFEEEVLMFFRKSKPFLRRVRQTYRTQGTPIRREEPRDEIR